MVFQFFLLCHWNIWHNELAECTFETVTVNRNFQSDLRRNQLFFIYFEKINKRKKILKCDSIILKFLNKNEKSVVDIVGQTGPISRTGSLPKLDTYRYPSMAQSINTISQLNNLNKTLHRNHLVFTVAFVPIVQTCRRLSLHLPWSVIV